MAGVVAEGARHVDVLVQVHTHHRLQAPQGQDHGALGVIYARDGIEQGGLGARQVQFGGPLHVVAALDLVVIGQRVFVSRFVHREGLLGEQAAEIGLLDLADRLEAGVARLLDGELDVLRGDADALPDLGVHQRHAGVHARGPGVPAAHLESVGPGCGSRGHRVLRTAFAAFAAAHSAEIKIHVHHLLLDGPLIGPGPAYLREKRGISALAGVSGTFDLLVRDLYGDVLAERDAQRVLQGKHRRDRRRIDGLGKAEQGEKAGNY